MTSRTRRGAGDNSVLTIPNALPVSGSLGLGSAKRVKREHEDGVYATTRRHRGAEIIDVSELRDEWRRVLLPSRGSVHTEGGEGAALAAEAALPAVPPLFLGACHGSEASQQLLTRVLAETIADADWQELWVLLGQISTCIEHLATPDAVRPWWVRQAQQAGGSGDVAEYVDLAAREAQGGADAPLDVEQAGDPVSLWSEGAVMKQEDEVPSLQAPPQAPPPPPQAPPPPPQAPPPSDAAVRFLGIGRGINDLMKRSEKNQQSSGLNFKYIEATKTTPVRYRARYQGISVRVDKNVEFTCGTYPTQEEAAIAVNLCKKRLGDIGAETYTDIENILNFDKKAFAKDIQDEVEKAIKHVSNTS